MKKKSIIPVKQATALAFEAMPDRFSLNNLLASARALMGRPSCTDGTITRRLRELRNEIPIKYNYRVIDNDRSIYQKIKKAA
ncbi:MAG: hypothetical protein A2W90_02480 [Bacteroidetes bacterium GWF2_42_66]|nr:MAG: hypothetical protein A2W92_16230 [Bacteroidetes bacterium GWA2_42_15]OFY01217.1 MAG: hypothetical protein A2W89_15965 [Bacteroidetes bacterium GWE2_42_39]OFY42060.1 MAG: hypothetical protein A2W90_02480 [Bacteroidetes bacterium GWF2_42_66]HBL77737.1 hypothetical protein [Prolixibacteraceae bacterium]HCB62866.1 hypothetical protein [Bacteroidales bacterium]